VNADCPVLSDDDKKKVANYKQMLKVGVPYGARSRRGPRWGWRWNPSCPGGDWSAARS